MAEAGYRIEAICDAIGAVAGWRLHLLREGSEVEQRPFDGNDEGFEQARQAGAGWLEAHAVGCTEQWLVAAVAGLDRIACDEDYRRTVSRRGF